MCGSVLWKRRLENVTHLASSLLQFDLDEQDEADQRHDHEEGQKDAHVEVLGGLLWGRKATHTHTHI